MNPPAKTLKIDRDIDFPKIYIMIYDIIRITISLFENVIYSIFNPPQCRVNTN